MEANARPRLLFVVQGELRASLSPEDVTLLVHAIDVMVDRVRGAYASEGRPGFADTLEAHATELELLRDRLVSSGSPLEPFKPEVGERRLLRSVLSDITGYQRGDLTPALRELRQIISTT